MHKRASIYDVRKFFDTPSPFCPNFMYNCLSANLGYCFTPLLSHVCGRHIWKPHKATSVLLPLLPFAAAKNSRIMPQFSGSSRCWVIAAVFTCGLSAGKYILPEHPMLEALIPVLFLIMPSKIDTVLSIPSFAIFCGMFLPAGASNFGIFPWKVGQYYSYLLPKNPLITQEEKHNKIWWTRGCATMYNMKCYTALIIAGAAAGTIRREPCCHRVTPTVEANFKFK